MWEERYLLNMFILYLYIIFLNKYALSLGLLLDMDYTIFFHVGICWNNMALSYFSGLTSFFPRTNRAVGLLPNMQMTLFSSFFDYDIYLICHSYVLIFKIRVRDGSDLRFMNLNIIVRSSCRELFIGHISVRCTKVAFTTFEWIGFIIILRLFL